MRALKDEYRRLVVDEGYNCSEAMMKVLHLDKCSIGLAVVITLISISVFGFVRWKGRR